MSKKNKITFQIAIIVLFAAIVCAGCFMKIPLGLVPIVLQNVLCILTATILGGIIGGAPTALFLIAGLIGLPVYAGGSSGIGVWLGATGGFYPGYLLGAIAAGLIAGRPSIEEKKFNWITLLKVSLAIIAGMVILYIPGVWRFASWALGNSKVPEDKSLMAYTMGACVIPYIPGDLLKIIVSIPIALKVRPVLAQYLYSAKTETKENNE